MKKLIGKLSLLLCLAILANLNYSPVLAGTPVRNIFPEDSSRVIPVEILDFGGAALNNKKIELWCKAKSSTSYTITVEHSRNGNDFVPIGSFFNKEEISKYTLVDYRPIHIANYYRLKITDARGRVNYSKLMVVQLYQTSTLSMVSVTPNPSVNDIHINVQLKDKAFVVMKITDADGKEIIKKRAPGVEGLNEFELEGSSKMAPGNYSLQVIVNSTESLSVPLIKS